MKNIIKKFLVTCAVFMAACLPILNINLTAYADDNNSPYYHEMGGCTYMLGLTNWDCGVDIKDEDSLKTVIWQIALNVAIDITVIAAYLIVGYVIYGGYLYIFSGGDPGKVATGKKALYQAFMGIAIILSANVIMNSIRIALLGDAGTIGDCATTQCVDPGSMIISAIQWVTGIAGVIAAIFVVYGGISYTTSSGDPGKIQTAKRMIIYSLIGLIIVAIAQIITAFVSSTINNSISTSNEFIIAKEIHEKIN